MNATDPAQHFAPTVGNHDPPTDAPPGNDGINIDQTNSLPNGDVHSEHTKSLDPVADACTMSNSPHLPDTIDPAQPPSGTPPPPPPSDHSEDVKMAETPEGVVEDLLVPNGPSPEPAANGSPNGNITTSDVAKADTDGDVPMDHELHVNGHAESTDSKSVPPSDAFVTYRSPLNATSPYRHTDGDDDDAKPPPAKRARKHSDADQASLANTASPPPATGSSVQMNEESVSSPAAVQPTQPGNATLSVQQHRFCLSTIRSLKKLKDASAFLHAVDPIALNIPHYPSIVKSPMDLGTIERKLMSSNPQKPDPNPNNPHYNNADEFIVDVRLVFTNCITFNGPDHIVSQAGKRVESVFDKQIKNLPPPQVPKPPIKVATPPPPPPAPAPAKKAPAPSAAARRASTSVPVIRRNETEQLSARPKREIHPPPPKDLPYADAPKKFRKPKVPKDDGTAEQLKFCAKILAELTRKQHWAIAHPFYEPVDPLKLEIPTYFKIIKKPMDLSTMRRKLENREYPNVTKFFDDFKLMIRNCFTFNPVGTPVNQAGIELQRLFDEKWKTLPPLKEASEDEEEEEEDHESEEERNRRIATIEAQIEAMRGNLMELKGQPAKEKKKKKEPTAASSSKGTAARNSKKLANAASGAGNGAVKRKSKKQVTEDDSLSFEQKKDLSEAIGKLDGQKLERVIQIIHEGVPEIRDSTEEIEIEIDLLPANVLSKLYNFVLRPLRQPAQKRNRPTGKGTGTGGLKRKSMDENAEAEKIRQLEERMKLFDNPSGTTGGVPHPVSVPRHDESDSDSSSDDSSASESE